MPTAEKILLGIVIDGGKEGAGQIGIEQGSITDQVNARAVEWARARAAEMVGKKYVDGELVDNPDAKYAITEGTRSMLRADVTEAIEKGWSTGELASALEDSYGFSSERAERIARTEIARADVQGNLIAYTESGMVEGKELVLSSEHGGDDECDEAADMGVVPLDDDFGGYGDPPLHPGCECDILPVLAKEEGEEG